MLVMPVADEDTVGIDNDAGASSFSAKTSQDFVSLADGTSVEAKTGASTYRRTSCRMAERYVLMVAPANKPGSRRSPATGPLVSEPASKFKQTVTVWPRQSAIAGRACRRRRRGTGPVL